MGRTGRPRVRQPRKRMRTYLLDCGHIVLHRQSQAHVKNGDYLPCLRCPDGAPNQKVIGEDITDVA